MGGTFPSVGDIVKSISEGDPSKLLGLGNNEGITLDYLEVLKDALKRAIDSECADLKELARSEKESGGTSKMLNDVHRIVNEITDVRAELWMVIGYLNDQIRSLSGYICKHDSLVKDMETHLVTYSVLNKLELYLARLDKLNKTLSPTLCIQNLKDAKKLNSDIQSVSDWIKESRMYKDLENASTESILASMGMIEYFLSKLVAFEAKDDNTIVMRINLEYYKNDISGSSHNLFEEIENTCGEEKYFFQVMRQINEIVIQPITNRPESSTLSIAADEKTLDCTVSVTTGKKDYRNVLEVVISILGVVKEGMTIACGSTIADKMLLFWGQNYLEGLRKAAFQLIDITIDDSPKPANTLMSVQSELERFDKRIRELIPNCYLLNVNLTHDEIQEITVSRICKKTLNDILIRFSDIKERKTIKHELDGRKPFYIHSYSASLVDIVEKTLVCAKDWPDKCLSIMFKTFREVFGLISRDVGILYRFSEQRSIRESVLYKNDIEYIYCYLNAIIGSYNYEGLDTIICSFKSDFENEVDNMLTVETELECHKVVALIRLCEDFHVSAFGNFKAKSILKEVTAHLKSISESVSVAHSISLFAGIMGKILDVCLSEIMTILFSMESISELECRYTEGAISSFIQDCSELVSFEGVPIHLDKYVASLKMISCILDIFRLDLTKIHAKIRKGSMDSIRGDCIKGLITSIFEDSPTRESVMNLIQKRMVVFP